MGREHCKNGPSSIAAMAGWMDQRIGIIGTCGEGVRFARKAQDCCYGQVDCDNATAHVLFFSSKEGLKSLKSTQNRPFQQCLATNLRTLVYYCTVRQLEATGQTPEAHILTFRSARVHPASAGTAAKTCTSGEPAVQYWTASGVRDQS